ncbi:Golgi transport complex subunit 3 [Bulinus truncatus]|nr:Golgi transport complex subunit 3 [Bulinus truncatus]
MEAKNLEENLWEVYERRGEKYGLTGEKLLQFIKENVEKEELKAKERVDREDRLALRNLEKEKLEMKKLDADRQEKLEKEKLEMKKLDADRQERLEKEKRDINNIPESEWTKYVLEAFRGESVSVLQMLGRPEHKSYNEIKQHLLDFHNKTEEHYRNLFHNSIMTETEHPTAYINKLESYLNNYIKMAGINASDPQQIIELMLVDKILNISSSKLFSFIKLKKVNCKKDLISTLSDYKDSNQDVPMFKSKNDNTFSAIRHKNRSQYSYNDNRYRSLPARFPYRMQRTCYYCHNPGHNIAKCKLYLNRNRYVNNGQVKESRYIPNRQYHRNSNDRSSGSYQGQYRNRQSPNNSPPRHNNDRGRSLNRNNKVHNVNALLSNNGNLIFYPCFLNNKPVMCLRDTGATCVVVDVSLVPHECMMDSSEDIKLGNGHTLSCKKAMIDIDTPWISGKIEAIAMTSPVAPLIIGLVGKDHISSRDAKLSRPNLNVTGETFIPLLSRMDECILYLKSNPRYKECDVYLARFRQCLNKALSLIKNHVNNVLLTATQQVQPKKDSPNITDNAFTLFYGKFRANAPRVKALTEQLELRTEKDNEYANALADCQAFYFSQRETLLGPSIATTISDLASKHIRDHCALMRSGCAFMVHVCEDEYQLYFNFFSKATPLLDAMLERICNNLYDVFRPLIIHINHLETLSELCSILKVEMMEEHIKQNPQELAAFESICQQMLMDIQERLVYRTYIYIKSDILQYNAAPGDLAYPEKLEMMESIAESIKKGKATKKVHSRTPSNASSTSQEVAMLTGAADSSNDSSFVSNGSVKNGEGNEEDELQEISLERSLDDTGSNMPMSPADLHGMWYPTVRRALVTLSKLYRCIDKTTFQGLSQEALQACINSLRNAKDGIIKRKQSTLDGELFLIKHLLILREQIAPFQADFSIRETHLDFSKFKGQSNIQESLFSPQYFLLYL